jgi:hypothetical protein
MCAIYYTETQLLVDIISKDFDEFIPIWYNQGKNEEL